MQNSSSIYYKKNPENKTCKQSVEKKRSFTNNSSNFSELLLTKIEKNSVNLADQTMTSKDIYKYMQNTLVHEEHYNEHDSYSYNFLQIPVNKEQNKFVNLEYTSFLSDNSDAKKKKKSNTNKIMEEHNNYKDGKYLTSPTKQFHFAGFKDTVKSLQFLIIVLLISTTVSAIFFKINQKKINFDGNSFANLINDFLPVDSQFVLDNVSFNRNKNKASESLTIYGNIINKGSITKSAPKVGLTLLQGQGQKVYQWFYQSPVHEIAAGKSVAFSTQINNPPQNTKFVMVKISNKNKLARLYIN